MSSALIFCHIDQKREARNVIENLVGTENMAIAATEGGILIVGAKIVIGTMSVIVESVTEIQTAPAIMIQEVTAGHALAHGNVPRIMIATGDCSSVVAIFLLLSFYNYTCFLLLLDK